MKILDSFCEKNINTVTDFTYIIPNLGNELTLEIYGDSTDFNVEIYGKVNSEGEYYKIGIFNMLSYSSLSEITSNGVYSLSISGLTNIKVSISNINNGEINIMGNVGE